MHAAVFLLHCCYTQPAVDCTLETFTFSLRGGFVGCGVDAAFHAALVFLMWSFSTYLSHDSKAGAHPARARESFCLPPLLPSCIFSWRPGAASLLWVDCALQSLSGDLRLRYGPGAALVFKHGPYLQALSAVGLLHWVFCQR